MTAKEYLSQAYYVDKRIQSKLRQVESLRDLATMVTSTLGTESVSGSKNVHRTEDTLDKIICQGGLRADHSSPRNVNYRDCL